MPATSAALVDCLKTIGQFGVSEHLETDLVARVLVVVEEVFLNTIKYGYAAECDRPVRLGLNQGSGRLTLTYEDEAPSFDPAAWSADGERSQLAPSLREGEAGLALLFGLADGVTHQPLQPGNRLVITFSAR